MRFLVLIFTASILAACAAPPDKNGPTLESLQSKTIRIDTALQSQASADVDKPLRFMNLWRQIKTLADSMQKP